MKVSVAASAGPVPPMKKPADRARAGLEVVADPLVKVRMTPDRCSIMWRAAARAVWKLAISPVVTGRAKSAVAMSTSGIPCASPREMRLKETSMLPAWAATARACSSTTSAGEPVYQQPRGLGGSLGARFR